MAGMVRVTHRDPVRRRYLFWATFHGGDPARVRTVEWHIAGQGHGVYTRCDGDQVGTLLRYDREATGFGGGASFDRRGGVWRDSELPSRNVWLGSDYGDEI